MCRNLTPCWRTASERDRNATLKAIGLDYDRAPRPGVVFGCLMPAPWLGAAAGVLLALGPVARLPDRFAPLALAAVHVLALGMLLPVMLGALFQMMPVVAGVAVPGSGRVAPLVALTASIAAGALAAGFLGGGTVPFRLAALAGGLLLPLAGGLLLWGGRRVGRVDATTRTLAGIGAPLALTGLLGAALAGLFGGLWRASPSPLLALHVVWGLGGWLAALVTGIATTVLPMFWQVPRLPCWLQRCLPLGHWLPLLAFTVLIVVQPEGQIARWAFWAWLAFAAVTAAFMLAGMLRARRRHDPVWLLWPVAAASMLAAALLAAALPQAPSAWLSWWVGTLALIGGGVLPVTAMLGKIVPFLVWLHLRRLLPPRARVPAMQAIINPDAQRHQSWLLLAAFAMLLALPLAPAWFARAGGLALALANGWLGLQLLKALRCMRAMRAQGGLPPRKPFVGTAQAGKTHHG
uniref:Transmembrane protein n=1 Tax=Cupriavidus pinatubonensis (strain JMP 134 / LMG 1197) TaxID=264198 RepID=Q46R23_CUPPJ